MRIRTLWQKTYRSWPGIFLIESLIFLYIALAVDNFSLRNINWTHLVQHSALLGLIGTIFVAITARKLPQRFGLTSRLQLWALKDAVNTNTIPKDEVLLRALPSYFLRIANIAEKNKNEAPRIIALFGFLSIVCIVARTPWMAIIFILYIAYTIYLSLNFEKKKAQYEAYYAKLVAHGIKVYSDDTEIESPKDKGQFSPLARYGKNKSLTVSLILLIILIAMVSIAAYRSPR